MKEIGLRYLKEPAGNISYTPVEVVTEDPEAVSTEFTPLPEDEFWEEDILAHCELTGEQCESFTEVVASPAEVTPEVTTSLTVETVDTPTVIEPPISTTSPVTVLEPEPVDPLVKILPKNYEEMCLGKLLSVRKCDAFQYANTRGISNGKTLLVHCVSRDLKMSAGFAKTVTQMYGKPTYDPDKKVTDHYITSTGIHEIAHLVTKEKYSDKPTYQSVWDSLKKLALATYDKKYELVFPKIACGLDGLRWDIVSGYLAYFFQRFRYTVCLHHLEPVVMQPLRPGTPLNMVTEYDDYNRLLEALEHNSYLITIGPKPERRILSAKDVSAVQTLPSVSYNDDVKKRLFVTRIRHVNYVWIRAHHANIKDLDTFITNVKDPYYCLGGSGLRNSVFVTRPVYTREIDYNDKTIPFNYTVDKVVVKDDMSNYATVNAPSLRSDYLNHGSDRRLHVVVFDSNDFNTPFDFGVIRNLAAVTGYTDGSVVSDQGMALYLDPDFPSFFLKIQTYDVVVVFTNESSDVTDFLLDLKDLVGNLNITIWARNLKNKLVNLKAHCITLMQSTKGSVSGKTPFDSIARNIGTAIPAVGTQHTLDNLDDIAFNAANEFATITEATVERVLKEVRQVYNDCVVEKKFHMSAYIVNRTARCTLVNLQTGKVYGTPIDYANLPTHIYAGDELIKLDNWPHIKKYTNVDLQRQYWMDVDRPVGVTYGVITFALRKFIDFELKKSLLRIQHSTLFGVNIVLVNGVPGGGKTKFIIDNHEEGDLVLTSTREAAIDLWDRVSKTKYKNYEMDGLERLSRNYRTADSYLINQRTDYDTVYFDEALMQHPGKVIYVISASRCKKLVLLGDKAQIPYVCRITEVQPRYIGYDWVEDVRHLDTTVRCPIDVAAVLRKMEKINIFSINVDRRNTIGFSRIINISEVPGDKSIQYLTFTQDEKNLLIKTLKVNNHYKDNVSTVHEFQGKQAHTIYVVRVNTVASVAIFNKSEYCLVALSRHTHKFRYYMTANVSTDKLHEYCQCATKLSEDDIIACTTTLEKYNQKRERLLKPRIKGGAVYTDHLLTRCDKPAPLKVFDTIKLADRTYKFTNLSTDLVPVPPVPIYSPSSDNVVFQQLSIIEPSYVAETESEWYPYVYHNESYNLRSLPPFETDYYEQEERSISNLVPNRPLRVTIEEPGLVDLQAWYDSMMGISSTVDLSFDADHVQFSPLNLSLANCTVVLDKRHPIRYDKKSGGYYISNEKKNCFIPKLRTALPPVREPTFTETILAFIKRNANVPQLVGEGDENKIVSLMVNKFVESYIDTAKLAQFYQYITAPLSANTQDIENWVTNSLKGSLRDFDPDLQRNAINNYGFMIKCDVKPQLNHNCTNTYQALQTIAFHSKGINAIFSPVFKNIRRRLYKVLKRNIVIFGDMSLSEFEERMNFCLTPEQASTLESMMVDISKYDKSQGSLMRKFERSLYTLLGMPPYLSEMWDRAHENSVLNARNEGFKARVKEQRKSGDANTFFGNTVFTMAVMAMVMDMNDVKFATFGGDDSVIVGRNIRDDRSHELGNIFNLEAKFCPYNYYYFCSRFIVPVEGRWRLVPDVLKLVTKLGRSNIRDAIHLEEYRRSLADLLVNAQDASISKYISHAYSEMYKTDAYLDFALDTLCSFVYQPIQFANLYEPMPEVVIEPKYADRFAIVEDVLIDAKVRKFFRNLIPVKPNQLLKLVSMLEDLKYNQKSKVVILHSSPLNLKTSCECYKTNSIKFGDIDHQRKKLTYRTYEMLSPEEYMFDIMYFNLLKSDEQDVENKFKLIRRYFKIDTS
jgi:hypothetical protein